MVTARFLVTAVGCLSAPNAPDLPGCRRASKVTCTSPRRGRGRASTSPGSASGSSARARAASRPHLRSPPKPITSPCSSGRRTSASRHGTAGSCRRTRPGSSRTYEEIFAATRHVVRGLPVLTDRPHHHERLCRRTRQRSSRDCGRRADSSSCGVASRTCSVIPKPTRSRRSSSATRSVRRSRIRTPPNCSAPRGIRMGPSGRRSTPTTTRRSIATT